MLEELPLKQMLDGCCCLSKTRTKKIDGRLLWLSDLWTAKALAEFYQFLGKTFHVFDKRCIWKMSEWSIEEKNGSKQEFCGEHVFLLHFFAHYWIYWNLSLHNVNPKLYTITSSSLHLMMKFMPMPVWHHIMSMTMQQFLCTCVIVSSGVLWFNGSPSSSGVWPAQRFSMVKTIQYCLRLFSKQNDENTKNTKLGPEVLNWQVKK